MFLLMGVSVMPQNTSPDLRLPQTSVFPVSFRGIRAHSPHNSLPAPSMAPRRRVKHQVAEARQQLEAADVPWHRCGTAVWRRREPSATGGVVSGLPGETAGLLGANNERLKVLQALEARLIRSRWKTGGKLESSERSGTS